MELTYLVIIIISLIFSAFFSGMEIAFVSSNKLRIEVEKKQEKSVSGILAVFTENPGQFIATMLVGNNIALVIYGIFAALILEPVLISLFSIKAEWMLLLLQTIISTLLILVTAEFLPKTLFRINPNRALNLFAIPVMFFYVVFYPVAYFTVWLSNGILGRIFKVEINKKQNTIFGKVDLDNFLRDTKPGSIEEKEELDVKIFRNALDFSNIKIRECILPRTEIVAIDSTDSLENLHKLFEETGLSKILVFKESIDNIIGYFHVSNLFKKPKSILSKIQPVSIVPETMAANKLLSSFIQEHKSIAVVVDEFGGTSGMVTIEDVMEEIFGEIEDEHDIIELEEKQEDENVFIFSGRLEIDMLNEKYKLNLPVSEEYETIAGYILYLYENIPEENDIIEIDNFIFQILEVSNTKINRVRLEIKIGK